MQHNRATEFCLLLSATGYKELPDVLSSAGILASRGGGRAGPVGALFLLPPRSFSPVLARGLPTHVAALRRPAYSTFRLRSHCVKRCLPGALASFGVYLNTLLTCRNVPGSHSAFLCRVKGHTLTLCARRRGSLGTRLALCTWCI